MAKPKSTKKPKTLTDIAAEEAADEALQSLDLSPEARDIRITDEEYENLTTDEIIDKDVFVDGQKLAQERMTRARYRIYRDSVWVGTFDAPYSWEKVQAKFGGGSYRVVAVGVNNNQILTSQTQEIASPENWNEPQKAPSENPFNTTLGMVDMIKSSQREAEEKAQANSNNQNVALAGILQASMQSTQTMMQVMMESSKNQMLLVTQMLQSSREDSKNTLQTLMTVMAPILTNKDSNRSMDSLQLMKLIQDAETKAEQRTKNWFELVEKKAESMAEDKAAAISSESSSEESLTKTLIKGFLPVLAQMNFGPQTPQTSQGQIGMQPHMQPGSQPQGVPGSQAQALMAPRAGVPQDIDTAKITQGVRPGPARQNPTLNQEIMTRTLPNTAVVRTVGSNAQRPSGPVAPAATTASNASLERGSVGPVKAVNVVKDVQLSQGVKEVSVKEKIIETIGMDLAQAALLNKKIPKVAGDCLQKLEKIGVTRQTVLDSFTLKDCKDLAAQYGVLSKVESWIEEFYAFIEKEDITKPATKLRSDVKPRSERAEA